MKRLHAVLLACLATGSLFSAEQTEAPPPPDQGFTQTLVMLAIALLFFYVILWRPEQKRRKSLEAKRSGMKKGDKVVAMGIVGTIYRIKDDTVIVNTGEDSKIEFLKAAISEVVPPGAPVAEKEG